MKSKAWDFAGLELIEDAIPDETTILQFRRLIEKHDLSSALFDDINADLESQGIAISKGSMNDVTEAHASWGLFGQLTTSVYQVTRKRNAST